MSEYQEVLRRARERWMEGEVEALAEFERGIGLALAAGDLPAALAAHQKLLVWRPKLSKGPELLGED